MSSPRPLVSAIIVTYNGREWLSRCIESIRKGGDVNLIVVDNGSQDESDGLARALGVRTVITLPRNFGFGHANNIGIQHAIEAGSEYILLLNQDIIVEPDCIQSLIDVLANNPDFGILSALQLNYSGTSVDKVFFHYIPRVFWDDILLSQRKAVYEVCFVPAAAVLLRASTFLAVGGFDPLFFLYAEDNDLVDRIQAHGLKAGIVPSARVQHWHGLINRPKTFHTIANREYSDTVLWLKRRNDSITRGILSRFRYSNKSATYTEWAAKIAGRLRAVCEYQRILRHRRICPCTFRPPSTTTTKLSR